MTQLTELELQNLRHLIGQHETVANKMDQYAQQATDSQFKQYFEQSSQEAKQTKQRLLSFLQ